MAIFNSYVKLPEGTNAFACFLSALIICWDMFSNHTAWRGAVLCKKKCSARGPWCSHEHISRGCGVVQSIIAILPKYIILLTFLDYRLTWVVCIKDHQSFRSSNPQILVMLSSTGCPRCPCRVAIMNMDSIAQES